MAKDLKAFTKIKRESLRYRPVADRIKDYKDVVVSRPDSSSQDQASRCMDCGTPFCHWGCPAGNVIPEWNELVRSGRWQEAYEVLAVTNNLPEVTSRVCPALCEYACVLGINDDPVTIRENELVIIERAFKNGYVQPIKPQKKTAKRVAVIGSGPAGLACAAQLTLAGHSVTVFERDRAAGGLMRYGIPDFKLEKWIIERRLDLYRKSGMEIYTGVNIGKDIPAKKLIADFDAVVIAIGSRQPRDLKVTGRELDGICFAMDYLSGSNKGVSGEISSKEQIFAAGKHVLVIGGGDTGSDCVGTAIRQAAASVTQIEIMPRPGGARTPDCPWPKYPLLMKTTSSHEEGVKRDWAVTTKQFLGENGKVKKALCARLAAAKDEECFEINADLVVLALGFLSPEPAGLIAELKLGLDARGNIKTESDAMSSLKGVFGAGDARTGQSLIIRALYDGRQTARAVDEYLMGQTSLPAI